MLRNIIRVWDCFARQKTLDTDIPVRTASPQNDIVRLLAGRAQINAEVKSKGKKKEKQVTPVILQRSSLLII